MKSPLLTLCLSLLLCSAAGAAPAFTDGLVSYWPLDVNDSGTTPDASFSNTLNVNAAPTVAAGQVSNAFTFNGTSTYVYINHSAATSFQDMGLPIYSAGAYSICFWVKGLGSQGTARYVFTEASTTSQNPLLLFQTGNATATRTNLDILVRNDSSTTLLNHVVSVAKVFDGNWHHIGWVDNNGACKLYVDGVLDSSFNYTFAGTMTFNTTAIGALARAAVSGFFAGSVDDVALWERDLSQAEVQQHRTSSISTPVATRPALFTTQPASVTKNVGDWVLYSANTLNNRPFTYQWFKNGSPIGGATDKSYRISDLRTNNTGDFYSVNVTNSAGFTSSTNAVITVLPDADPALTNSIISFWPLDEVSNTPPVTPEAYASAHMALTNLDGTALVVGQYGNALLFDGLTQYARRLNGFPAANGSAYSVSLWVRGDGNTQNSRRVFSEGNSTNNAPLFTIATDPTGASQGASVFIRNDANSPVINSKKSTRLPFDNNWHHIVWTDANGKGKLYIDGTLDETDFTYTRTGTYTLDITSLGAVVRAAPSDYYFGAIDEVASWNRVLSWTEIQQLLTNSVPHPAAIIPPSISIQPADKTNGVFQADSVSFVVQATGTVPLSYQWRRNGVNINGISNPSALTNILTLSNVQTSDAGPYSVVITNSGGSVTSTVAQLTVTPYAPATTGEVLKVDFGLVGSPTILAGFSEMTLGTNPTNFSGVNVTLSTIAGALDARNRSPFPVNNPPYVTQGDLYNDFIFQTSAADGTGVRMLIERLAPNTKYGVTLWSWDSQSNNGRISDWTETASGSPITIQTGYTISGTPTNDYEFTLGGLLTSSSSGQLRLEGVRHGGATGPAVIVNGIRLVANPVPNSQIIRVQLVGSTNVFSVVSSYPSQVLNVQQNTNLVDGMWVSAINGGPVATNGMVTTFAFPATETQLFYRVASPSN